MDAETASSEAPPPRFSRYRSVRRAHQAQVQQATEDVQIQQTPPVPAMPAVPAVHAVPAVPAMPQTEPQKEATISRSMSRYHRRPQTSHTTSSRPPPVRSNTVEVPPLPSQPPTGPQIPRNRAVSSPQEPVHPESNAQARLPNTSRSRAEPVPSLPKSLPEPSQQARDEAKRLMQVEAERQRRMQEQLKAEKRAKWEAEQAERAERERQEKLRLEEEEAARIRAQQEAEEAERQRRVKEEQERSRKLQKAESSRRLKQREEDERRAREETARKAQMSPPVSPPRHGGGLGLFKRRKDDPTSPERSANAVKPPQTSNGNRDLDTIRPGGGGAVLGIDAPISAVNAGDRRVKVTCNNSSMEFPVTPTTTPLDLIKSASNCMTETIDVRTAVVLESFYKVSLQRPLRNYEHVRDVMNSWDDDRQNELIIVDTDSHNIDQRALLASQVADTKPEGMGCYIHYSSKPGKWSKRYISLRNDGQLLISKSETAKDKDTDNICHLSDFDVYSPTQRKLAKVKPPKKICYAVKSQQKSNIFSDETRYVHFFCTNDKSTAALFYRSLQSWRSWYLKHVMGEGQKKTKAVEPKPSAFGSRNVSGSGEQGTAGAHARGASVGSHYQLGTFTPLLDMDLFGKGKDDSDDVIKNGAFPDDAPLARFNSQTMHARKMSTRQKNKPPIAYNLVSLATDSSNTDRQNSLQNSLAHSTSASDDSETFAAGGLLGRTYSKRQRETQEREKKNNSGPFVEGPSLISNMNHLAANATNDGGVGLGRKASTRSAHRRTSSDLQRSASTRHAMPKPLVDLTPQYREPPQHSRKGKGFNPDGSAGPLIDNATSLDEAIKIPSSTEWRARPSTSRYHHGTYGQGGHERTRSLKGRGEGLAAYTVNNHSTVPEDESNAFTGGLLAGTGFSQGHVQKGRGVMDGSRAKGPMLDMRDSSRFAQGSLLAGVEHTQGPAAPVIDRSRRQSVDLG